MDNRQDLVIIKQRLLDYADTIVLETLLPTIVPEAAPLVANDPYAFLIATSLDRGMLAEIIWTIPYYIKEDLGHLDPNIIYRMSLDELSDMFARLPKRPRYINDAPTTLKELTRMVVEDFKGDASKLWQERRATEAKKLLMSIHGVGPGIANMGLLLIEKNFGVHFDDLDRSQMDIKPDVHTVRVLYRLGVSDAQTTNAAIMAAQRLSPDFPGAVDGALWDIGRKYCSASDPNCSVCPMDNLCAKRLATSTDSSPTNDTKVVKIIRNKFLNAPQPVQIPLQKGGLFTAKIVHGGIRVDNLGNEPFLPWEVFEKAVMLLDKKGGRAQRGDAMNSKLGDENLPLDSIEGYIALKVYGRDIGDSVFCRISPIAGILTWAGICEAEPGELKLVSNYSYK